MGEQLNSRQLFLREAERSIGTLRSFLSGRGDGLPLLPAAVEAADFFKKAVSWKDVSSFQKIGGSLEPLLSGHLSAKTVPGPIEFEIIELAVDWLAQLLILFEENLPEPKSLVAELLYTFKLVGRYRDAATLVELVDAHAEKASDRIDPFFEDPDFSVVERKVPTRPDPFADDPGFGLEFDLLQRTMNFATDKLKVTEDPFVNDPLMETEENQNSSLQPSPAQDLPFDVFSGDPPFLNESDDKD